MARQTFKDSGYFLKIVLYLILGSLWLKIKLTASDGSPWILPIPVGLVIGFVFASHDHFKIDRKIEYAVLLVSAVLGFWLPIGLYVGL